ncbi:MAG: hypothetical protein WC343_12105 [Bacilli bacterium]|jgi:hypothetical protein
MANRETRRKQRIRREDIIASSNGEGISSLGKVCIVVVITFIIFYVITILVTGGFDFSSDEEGNTDEKTAETIQYDEILAGETFNMNDSEYYVIFYDFEETTADYYSLLISNYESTYTEAVIYKVDLSKGINDTYTGDVSNPNVSSIGELIVKGPTLIKISNGNNILYREGKEAIKASLD